MESTNASSRRAHSPTQSPPTRYSHSSHSPHGSTDSLPITDIENSPSPLHHPRHSSTPQFPGLQTPPVFPGQMMFPSPTQLPQGLPDLPGSSTRTPVHPALQGTSKFAEMQMQMAAAGVDPTAMMSMMGKSSGRITLEGELRNIMSRHQLYVWCTYLCKW